MTAFALLVLLQFSITWLSVRSDWARQAVKAEPTLLFHSGSFLRRAMKRERVTEEDLRAAIRGQGIADLAQVEGVVLETDGSFNVLQTTPSIQESTLPRSRKRSA